MPLVYDVSAENKVTVRKIPTMRNRWYTAAHVVQQYLNSKLTGRG